MSEPAVLELGTGFRDDDVSVLVDGREVWSAAGVTTDYSVGLAAVVPLPATGPGEIEVRVGDRARGARQVPAQAASGPLRLRCDLDPAGAMALGTAPEGPIF